jgi:hypothetical protein
VSFVNRLIVALLVSFSIAQGADCDPSAIDPANNEVIELREMVMALTGDPDLNSTLDMLAAVQVRAIGAPNDPNWKGENPNWSAVYSIVHDDLSRDVGLLLVAQVRDMAAHWDHELPAHLTPGQIDELVKFFRSDVGLRYLTFQKRLMAIQKDVLSTSVVGRPSTDADSHRVPVVPTAAQIDSRKRVAAFSWLYQVISAIGPTANPGRNAGEADDKTIHDMMVDALATMRGPELDQLSAQYQADLAAFATFQGSQVAKGLMLVYGFVAKALQADPAAPGIAFAAALQRSVEQHKPEWKAAYEEVRSTAH